MQYLVAQLSLLAIGGNSPNIDDETLFKFILIILAVVAGVIIVVGTLIVLVIWAISKFTAKKLSKWKEQTSDEVRNVPLAKPEYLALTFPLAVLFIMALLAQVSRGWSQFFLNSVAPIAVAMYLGSLAGLRYGRYKCGETFKGHKFIASWMVFFSFVGGGLIGTFNYWLTGGILIY